MRQKRKQQKRTRPSSWSSIRAAAYGAGLRGSRQWQLLHHFEHLGYRYRQSIWKGSKKLAGELGNLDRNNTHRRLKRFEELGLVRTVQGGGRRRGCSKDDKLLGLANRYYPGPAFTPAAITDKWIADDNARELVKSGQRPQLEATPSPLSVDRSPREPATRPP